MAVTHSDARLTVPNVMTGVRIAMALVAAVCFGTGSAEKFAVVLCAVAALLDVFDGWYARAFAQCSTLGKHLDPLADKLLMGVVYGVLAFNSGSAVVWTLIGLVALREVGMTVFRAYSLRRHHRFIPANRLGKFKMVVQSVFGLSVISAAFFFEQAFAFSEVVLVPALSVILAISYFSAGVYIRLWFEAQGRGTGDLQRARDSGDNEDRRMVVGK